MPHAASPYNLPSIEGAYIVRFDHHLRVVYTGLAIYTAIHILRQRSHMRRNEATALSILNSMASHYEIISGRRKVLDNSVIGIQYLTP